MNKSHVSEELAAIILKEIFGIKSEENKLDIRKLISGIDYYRKWPKEPEPKRIYFNQIIKDDNDSNQANNNTRACYFDLQKRLLVNDPKKKLDNSLFEDVRFTLEHTTLLTDILVPLAKRSLLDIIKFNSSLVYHHKISKYEMFNSLKNNSDYQQYARSIELEINFDEVQKQCEFVLYRLQLLGVIENYSNNYSSGDFEVEFKAPETDTIIRIYEAYLEKYRSKAYVHKRITALKTKIDSEDLFDHYSCIFDDLSRFFDENVQKKRNQALQEMYQTADLGIHKSKEEIRDLLDHYFNSKFISDLTTDTDGGKEEKWETILKYINEVADPAKGSRIENLEHMEGACSRLLQEYPDNYVLLILRSMTLLCLANSTQEMISTGMDYFRKGWASLFESIDEEGMERIYDQVCIPFLAVLHQDLADHEYLVCHSVNFALYTNKLLKNHNDYLKTYRGTDG
jgi:hypothetical protein